MSSISDRLKDAAATAGMYRLLAHIWSREVDATFLQQLDSQPLRGAFTSAGGVVPEHHDPETIESLAIDYCQLFVGPKDHLPPVQSVWQTGQLESSTTTSMRSFMEVVGYERDQLPRGQMHDHLGVQLDVMGHIMFQLSSFKEDQIEADPQKVSQIKELVDSYFTLHLTWPERLLEIAESRATTDFYRSIMNLTRGFLQSEARLAAGSG